MNVIISELIENQTNDLADLPFDFLYQNNDQGYLRYRIAIMGGE